MTCESCNTCFYHLPVANESSSCFCTKGDKFVERANTFLCADYDNAEEHVYTLDEVACDLLYFCNDLIDDMIYYSSTQQIPSVDSCSTLCKKYRKLSNYAKELGIVL